MVRIPVSAVFDAQIPNMTHGIQTLCESNRSIVNGGIRDMETGIRGALARRQDAYGELRDMHEDVSACSIPIATYDRVCDTTWLCCTLTLKLSGNQHANDTTPATLESIKKVPPQVKSWTAFFRSILANDVYSSYGRAPEVSSAYNKHAGEYILVISAEQFIKKGDRRALDRKIATRNVRGTLQISDDHAQFFGERGFRCVRERWAFSHKPLQADRPGVVLPTVTMGKVIDLVRNSEDCFQSKFGDEIRLLEMLRSEIDNACKVLDDPIKSNIFNIQALFVRESTYESVTSVVLPEGIIRTATQVIESKLDDANDSENAANQLFDAENLDDLANNQYFAMVSSYLTRYVVPTYLDRWRRTELDVIDPKYYEWNLRTSKYKEEEREASLYLNKALTNMVALNNSRNLEGAVSPASASDALAKCIGEIRTVYTGIKASRSILIPLVTVLDRQQKIQSKSARVGKRGTVSDVTALRRLVLDLSSAVFEIDTSLSKQHLRVCDACESLHGRLESSIPEGMLIHRIRNTLGTVKRMLTDDGVLNVLKSIKFVCEKLRTSGNLGEYTTKLTRAYDWIPADNNFAFTTLDVGGVIESIVQPVMRWEGVYENYRDLVVGAFLHVMLSKDEIVSVSISKSENVSTDSSNRRGRQNDEATVAMEQAEVAENEEQQRQASEEDATVNLSMEREVLNRLYREYDKYVGDVRKSVDDMTTTIEAYQKENKSLGDERSNHTIEENEFLNQDGPGSQSSIVVRLYWIEMAHTIMTPIPNKSNPIARLRNTFNKEYDKFQIVYIQMTRTLCNFVSTVLRLYDNIPRNREVLLYEIENATREFLEFYANTPEAKGGPADDVRAAMQTLVNTTRQRRENLQTDPNPLESAKEVARALFDVSLSMDAASNSDAKTAWNYTRGRWEGELKLLLDNLPPVVDKAMRLSLSDFERLLGNLDDGALEERLVNMFPSISSLLDNCFQQMRRVQQLLSPG
jgi:hypothetical protein